MIRSSEVRPCHFHVSASRQRKPWLAVICSSVHTFLSFHKPRLISSKFPFICGTAWTLHAEFVSSSCLGQTFRQFGKADACDLAFCPPEMTRHETWQYLTLIVDTCPDLRLQSALMPCSNVTYPWKMNPTVRPLRSLSYLRIAVTGTCDSSSAFKDRELKGQGQLLQRAW